MKLEEMISYAGEASEPPPPPPLPKQRLPHIIRWGVRLLFLPFVILDQISKRIAKWLIKPPLVAQGKCKRRGNCCYFITMRKTRWPWGALQKFWVTEINSFFFRSQETVKAHGRESYVLGCRYLQKDGSCKHYFFRPTVCREWPKIEWFGHPQILKGCGYAAADRENPLRIISNE